MADGELGNLRRAPRLIEHKIAKQSRFRTEGMAGGQFDAVIPVDVTDTISSLSDSASDGGGPVPEWFTESLTLTSGAAATWPLTYIPLDYSEVISLNGIVLVETVDYTIVDNIVTWVNLADLILGIGADSWNLTATYPYYDQAAPPDPSFGYIATAGDTAGTPVTMTGVALADDVGFFVCNGWSTGVSGGFATWTHIFTSSGQGGVNVWMGTGVGTGTSVSSTYSVGEYAGADSCKALVVFHDVSPTPTLRSTQASGGNLAANPTAPPLAAAVVGDIVVSAWYGTQASFSAIYSDGTHVDTGFTGTFAENHTSVAFNSGVAVSVGIATASSVGSSFGIVVSGTAGGQAVNLVLAV